MIIDIDKKTPQFTQLYLKLVASITLLLGTILIISPGFISNLFFDTSNNSVDFFVRMLGSTLVGYGSVCILAIKVNTIQAAKLAVWANLSTLLVATVISLSYGDIYTGYGWLVIGQHVVFTSGFLYCAWELSHSPLKS